jgi:signal transduction histidine kinase
VLTIKDSGMGIPKDQQPFIFKKMFRASNVQNLDGTGFGLYLLKSIVDFSEGSVAFSSEEGKGTTFTVKLPLTGMKKRNGTSRLNPV